MMLNDAQSFVRIQNIFNAENFDRSLRKAAHFIFDHTDKQSTMPTLKQVNDTCGTNLKEVPDLNDGHYNWFFDEFVEVLFKGRILVSIIACCAIHNAAKRCLSENGISRN